MDLLFSARCTGVLWAPSGVGTRVSRLVPSKTLGVLFIPSSLCTSFVLWRAVTQRCVVARKHGIRHACALLCGDFYRSAGVLTAIPRSLRKAVCGRVPPCPGPQGPECWLCLLFHYAARSN